MLSSVIKAIDYIQLLQIQVFKCKQEASYVQLQRRRGKLNSQKPECFMIHENVLTCESFVYGDAGSVPWVVQEEGS